MKNGLKPVSYIYVLTCKQAGVRGKVRVIGKRRFQMIGKLLFVSLLVGVMLSGCEDDGGPTISYEQPIGHLTAICNSGRMGPIDECWVPKGGTLCGCEFISVQELICRTAIAEHRECSRIEIARTIYNFSGTHVESTTFDLVENE